MSKKENLLKTIETAFNNTNNSCKVFAKAKKLYRHKKTL